MDLIFVYISPGQAGGNVDGNLGTNEMKHVEFHQSGLTRDVCRPARASSSLEIASFTLTALLEASHNSTSISFTDWE